MGLEIERKWVLIEGKTVSELWFDECLTYYPHRVEYKDIQQAYIKNNPNEQLRIRMSKKHNDEKYYDIDILKEFELTIKTPTTDALSRNEYNIEIDESYGQSIWNLIKENHIIKKERFIIKRDPNSRLLNSSEPINITIDSYRGKLCGLTMLEVEFRSIESAEKFQFEDIKEFFPGGFKDLNKSYSNIFDEKNWKEVTDNPIYKNSSLVDLEMRKDALDNLVLIKR